MADPHYEIEQEDLSEAEIDALEDISDENIPVHVVADNDPQVDATQEINPALQQRPKKGRKRKIPNQTRKEKKIRMYTNKPYFNYKSVQIQPKEFVDFRCNCTSQCAENVPVESRRSEFDRFWSLNSYEAQNNFIAASVLEIEKKRSYGRNTEKRKFSRIYKITDTKVCREMFINTLKLTTFRVNTALKKFHGRAPIGDQRGLRQGGKNKLTDERIQAVVNHINKIPKYSSHYRREQTKAEYLPPGITIQKMYDMYKQEEENPVSLMSYKNIFYTKFNLKIKALKKDTCNVCDALKMKTDNEKNEEKKEKFKQEHNKHLQVAEEAQKMRRDDFKIAKEEIDHECLSFDLEKTLPLPRIPTGIVFYKRQLWVYNAGIHSAKESRGYCYVWVEGSAGRGAQEIGSCLIKHVKTKLPIEVKHLTLWCDSCGGQNRNIKLMLMLKSILHGAHTNLESVTVKYLCSGHSFLPNDTDFSDIESSLKRQQRLYTPSDYIEVMRSCRKKRPLIVTQMSGKDFLGVMNIEKKITNRKITDDKEKINWLKIRSIKIEKQEPFSLMIQQHDFSQPYQKISIKKSSRGRPGTEEIFSDLLPLWPNGKPIAEAKLQNLKEMMHLIPADALPFYQNLQSVNITEDVEGYNVEDLDFEVDDVE